MDLNFEHLHLFIEGMKFSREQHAEENKSYEYGLNGRLYSENGKLSFSSIKGTLEIYNDPNIIKYLGFYAFPDELVVFVKYASQRVNSKSTTNATILGSNITVNIPFGSSQHVFTNELLTGVSENFNTIIEEIPVTPDDVLLDNYNAPIVSDPVDLSSYYLLSGTDIPSYEICDISGLKEYEYNSQHDDAIIVFRKNGYSALTARIAWVGKMNWDINRKITTVGIDENMYYKRVYFTDNLNPLRVVNLKDNRLEFRASSEFDIKQNSLMLQPLIKEIKNGGSIKAMTVQYAYKLITENGQVTTFSPYSEQVYIVRDNDGYDFEGGDIDERTTKQVVIQIPILNLNYKEVQAIAIEFAADTIPTAIRNLGIKPIGSLVEFTHNGNESEFAENFTLEDITETGNIWTYCSDITAKNNKLIAAGLRNEPYALSEKYVQDLFLFKGWNDSLETHDYLINPDPKTYRYIDPLNEENAIYTKKTLYNRFLFFGNVTLTLKNRNGASQSITFTSSADEYIEYIEEVWTWLDGLQKDGTINSQFPNLLIRRSNLSILFSPKDPLIETDMFNYYFETSISQAIIDFDNEYAFYTVTPNANNLVYGAQSVGFNQGTGVRVSFKEVKEPVLNKSPEFYESGPLLDLETPTLKKTFVKGEIYRLSIQFFSKGNPLFAIVCGDVYTPNSQDKLRYIDEDGTLVILTSPDSPTYVNQSIDGNQLMAHRLEMRVEVRISCFFKGQVDSYQMQYVERTENNRTILCQGLSAPLCRLVDWENPSKAGISYAPNVYSNWTLPYNGGPLYTVGAGFVNYDDPAFGEDFNELSDGTDQNNKDTATLRYNSLHRETVNRKMFYFDSPDLIHDRVSPSIVKNAKLNVIARVNTDATLRLLRDIAKDDETYHGKYQGANPQVYQPLSFSRKLGYSKLSGNPDQKPYTVNISIFSNVTLRNDVVDVDKASDLLTKGEIISSAVLGTAFDASNMALVMFHQSAYNDGNWRGGNRVKEEFGSPWRYGSESMKSSQESHGYTTMFIRADEAIFTDDFIGPQAINPIQSAAHQQYADYWLVNKLGNDIGHLECSDSHAIINITLDNAESIYGGRSKYAYAQNVFIPLGAVIPIKGSENDNQAQIFNLQGDFFVTLFLRAKNDYSDLLPNPTEEWSMRHHWKKYDNNDVFDWSRGGAWAYGVILETEVEERLSSSTRYYKTKDVIDFSTPLSEIINSAYFKKNNLRVYNPVPFNFKDDPLLIATLSASKTKLNGDYFDAWTEFLLNEFYDLEKHKGGISNITSWKDSLFAIQQQESSEVFIDESDFITTESGENVAIKKGDGRTFTNHKKISDFGTSIRRALCEGELGFSFFDERNRAFVKFGESLSLTEELQAKLHQLFEYDKIIDTEGYYDVKYKETNIRLRTESGAAYLLSYNELLGKFNGWFAYNHDIYMTFDKRVFVPCCGDITVIVNCPVIFSAATVSTQIGQYFEYQIQATEDPLVYNATNLPNGLNVNTLTGLIYGVITTEGIYTITIYAENEQCYDTLDIVVTANIDQLYGNIIGTAIVTGFLSGKVQIEGNTDGIAIVTGTLTWGKSQITAQSDGLATVTAALSYRVDIFGHIEAGATVTPNLWTFNLFFGEVANFFPDQNSFAPMMDAGNSEGSTVAYWSDASIGFKAWIRNHYHGATYKYENEVQTWVVIPKKAFYTDSFYSNSNINNILRPNPQWIIDVQGKITRISQGLLSSIRSGLNKTICEWIYFPGVEAIGSGGGYFTLRNLINLRGYITFPELVQEVSWPRDNINDYVFGENNYADMNHVLNDAWNVDVLHMPKIKRICIQYSDRYVFYNMTNVRRVYMPLMQTMLSACKQSVNGSYDPLIDPVRDRRIFGGTSAKPVNGVPTIFYLHPSLATNRRSDAMIRISRTVPVQAGDTVTINGLVYTAVNGTKLDRTQFRCDYPGDKFFKDIFKDLRNSVNYDTRVGTLGKCYIDQELLPDGGPAYGLIKAYDNDPIYDAIEISTTSSGIFLSSPTLMYGGTEDRNLVSWILDGAEIRYVDNFEPPPFEVSDLSVSNITATSAVLNFTPPVEGLNGTDFYEVWIYDGTALKDLFVPRMEILGPGVTITGLTPGRIQTIKIVTRDTLYNCLEDLDKPGTPIFSNEIKFATQMGGASNTDMSVTGVMYQKNTATGNAILEGTIESSLTFLPNLVSVWKLNNNANDSTGVYDGTEYNITYEAGKLEQAARFNGSNSYIDCGNAVGLALTEALTIMAWVNLDTYNVANSGCVICTWVSPGWSTYPFHYVFQSNGILRLNANNIFVDTVSVIPLGTWTHVAVTRSASGEVNHYINGVLDSTGNQTIPTGPVSGEGIFTIGRKDDQFFDGLIDDLGIANREFTPEEIEYAFNAGNANISLGSQGGTNGKLTDVVDIQGISTINGDLSAKGELGGTIDGQTTITV